MSEKKFHLTLSAFLLTFAVVLFGPNQLQAWDKESWLKLPPYQWKSENQELAKAWEEMIGFQAPDVVGKKALEIKPGMIIDSSNYKDFPALKELLIPSLYIRLDPDHYAPLTPIKVVETNQYHITKGVAQKCLESMKTCKIGSDGISLEGFKGGYPFPRPKTGLEMAWNIEEKYFGDTFYMNPMWLRLYGRDNRPERDMKWVLGGVRWKYRCDWGEDFEPNPEGVKTASSGWFYYPRDISGTCYLRRKFADVNRTDEFLLYLPSMRRVRRMGGRDAQDPMFGADVTWDDFQGMYQKISPVDFHMEWKIIEKTEYLLPTWLHVDYAKGEERPPDSHSDDSDEGTFLYWASWQRRPVITTEAIELDKRYMYSKRIIYHDRETLLILHTEFFDQAGRLWRTWTRDGIFNKFDGSFSENLVDVMDYLNVHRTILDAKGISNPKWVGQEYSDMKFIIRKAK